MVDQDRQIRFLIPPFFFYASLAMGLYLGGRLRVVVTALSEKPWKELHVLLIAAIGAATIPIGYIIGLVGIRLVSIVFLVLFWRRIPWDVQWSDNSLQSLWRRLGQTRDRRLDLQASSYYVHSLLPETMYEWILRRWTAFLVAVHSMTALFLSHLVGRFALHIPPSLAWMLTSVVVSAVLLFAAVEAWQQVERMHRFQLQREVGRLPQ